MAWNAGMPNQLDTPTFDARVGRKIAEYARGGACKPPERLYLGRRENNELMGEPFSERPIDGGNALYRNLRVFVVDAISHLEIG